MTIFSRLKTLFAAPLLWAGFGVGVLFLLTSAAKDISAAGYSCTVELQTSNLPLSCGSLEATPMLPRSASAINRPRTGNGFSVEVRPLPRFSAGNANGETGGNISTFSVCPVPEASGISGSPSAGIPLIVDLKNAIPERAGPKRLS